MKHVRKSKKNTHTEPKHIEYTPEKKMLGDNVVVRGVRGVFKGLFWLLKKLFTAILILIALFLIVILYSSFAEVNEDDKLLFDYYKETVQDLEAPTSSINYLRDNILTDIVLAEEDGKITINEFAEVQAAYKELEALSFKTAVEVYNRDKKANEAKKEKDSKESEESQDDEPDSE